MKKTVRCFSFALIGVALMLAGVQTAWAHKDPGNSVGVGVSLTLTVFRADQKTSFTGSVNQCETIYYQATLTRVAGTAALEGGTLCIDVYPLIAGDETCFGAGFPLTAQIPCLGGTTSDSANPAGNLGDTCPDLATSFMTPMVKYEVNVADCTTTPSVSAAAEYTGGFAHDNTPDGTDVEATLPKTLSVVCCAPNAAVCKEDDSCDPTLAFGAPIGDDQPRLGGCVVGGFLDTGCPDALCDECVPGINAGPGTCEPITDPDVPEGCEPGDEICRTPGFFGTHGGTEKEERSTNITLALLDAYNAANTAPLEICGTPITNTDCGSENSALEAICVSPKGNSLLQLGRQLTAAALNCILTNSTGDPTVAAQCGPEGIDPGLVGEVCDGVVSIEAIFDACNAACAADPGSVTADVDLDGDSETPDVEVSCIAAIDCFNNGFLLDEFGDCTDESSLCHEADLDNGCFDDFTPPGAAGSPRECNDSRKNCITIFGTIPGCTGGTAPCPPEI